MSEKKFIIFDLDGTLIDSFDTVVNTCKKVSASYSCEDQISDDYFKSYRFKDMEQMFEELAEMVHISISEFRHKYDELYAEDCISGSLVITKQYEILKEAKVNGIGIIVLTNKKQEIAEEVCGKLLGDNMVDIVIGRRDTQPIKPRHVILDRLYEYGIHPHDQCLAYYGDSESDLKTAVLMEINYINTNHKEYE